MWPQLSVSQKLTFTLLFGASLHIVSYPRVLSLRDTVLLWLLPALLIPTTTSAVGACYIFTGNSGERQRQTWIVEMTCRERPMSVCFAWECEVRQITRKPRELNCQWLHLLSRESFRALWRWRKKKYIYTQPPTSTVHTVPLYWLPRNKL